MYARRNSSIFALFLVFSVTLAAYSPASASDADDMKHINEVYTRLLTTYSETCIAKDSLADSCIDVAFAKKNTMLSSSLKALLDKDAKRAKKNGMGNLDFNFLINGQDYCKAPLRIVSLKKGTSGYILEVNNGCKREKDYNPNYEFIIINESGQWVIDDAAYHNGKNYTLKSILK